MKNLGWKFGIALLTFLVGTILALIWLTFNNKQVEIVATQIRPSEIEIIVPESNVPEPPSDNKVPAKPDVSENPPVRYIKGSGKFCEKYLVKKIAKEKSANSRLVKLKNFNPEDETLSLNIKKWLESMRWEELLAAELSNSQQKALLLRSTSEATTGLASNLENWHIEIEGVYSDTFWSFSKNPNLVFWDKDGLLNYFSIVYSDKFIENKDWENLTFNIERYKVSSDGKAQLINEERNLKCEW
jgi:hypothetical protein